MTTYATLLQDIQSKLHSASIDADDNDARFIVQDCFNLSSKQLLLQRHQPINAPVLEKKCYRIVKERMTGCPLAYCLGHTEFMGHSYKMKKGVLIPRPETELLVEKAIDVIQNHHPKIESICECGFGSGVISIELAKRFPHLQIHAWDISKKATQLAKENSQRHHSTKINWIQGDFFKDLDQVYSIAQKSHCLIISNPPYIPSDDIQGLNRSVKEYEPKTALNGGKSGLVFYKRLFKGWYHIPIIMMAEIGIGQKNLIEILSSQYPQFNIQFYNDIQHIPRIFLASNGHS